MPDPATLSLASLGATALTEGIKFLYGQAGELLKRWRGESKAKSAEGTAGTLTVNVNLPAGLVGDAFSAEIPFKKVEEFSTLLTELRRSLYEYADDSAEVTAGDRHLIEVVEQLRSALETIYQRRLTFVGEDRPPSGSVVGLVDADILAGDASGVSAEEISGSARVSGTVRAGRVETGGSATGVKAGRIG